MISTSLDNISQAIQAKLIGENCLIDAVSTDTRKIEAGSLFIALVGDNFDAHDFCQQAMDAGASALLVERKLDVELPQLVVDDTRLALGKLGAWVYKQCNIKTLAITGSCGKTTVKEMVSEILSIKGNVLFTAGNFNNDIGVPLTLLRSKPEHDFAVIELGANHLDEIAYTANLVNPSVALVNNVEAAHLEGFGCLDGVKQAKGEIFQGLTKGGTAIINLDSQGNELWHNVLAEKHTVCFSVENSDADFTASNIKLDNDGNASFVLHTPIGDKKITLSVAGKHNVSNALAASALAMEFGCSLDDIAEGLVKVVNVKGRVDVQQLTATIRLIDDSYNASVPAMKAAVDLLSSYAGVRWLILGYMAELGSETLALHRQLGDYAARFKFDYVLTYGEFTSIISNACGGKHFATHEELICYMEQQLQEFTDQSHTLLIKGANSARMSVVTEALKEMYK